MVNLTQLKEKAKQLNLQNVANDEIDLSKEYKTNIDFLDYVFTKELEIRKQRRVEKLIKLSGFPKTIFNFNKLSPVISWQIEKLLEMQWIEDNQNLFVIGECNTGKTSLISYIALQAIEKEYKAIYLRIDELLEESAKTAQLLRNADLIVIDDIMYLPLTNEKNHGMDK